VDTGVMAVVTSLVLANMSRPCAGVVVGTTAVVVVPVSLSSMTNVTVKLVSCNANG